MVGFKNRSFCKYGEEIGGCLIDYRNDNKWTVYIHIVPKELSDYDWDKYYVGITSLKPEHRWGCEGNGYSKRGIFGRAIKKYGWENILHEIVANNLTESEAKNLEKKLIETLSSNDKTHGYNLTVGGDGKRGFAMSNETKEKISKANSGKRRSEEQIERIKNNTPVFKYEENPSSKPIYQFAKDGLFIKKYCSAVKVEDECGYKAKVIRKNALHETKSSYGFIWVYEQDVIFENSCPKLKDISLFTVTPKKKVYSFTYYGKFINKYDSINDAIIATGEPEGKIRGSAQNKTFGNNTIWRYEDDVFCINGEYKIKNFVEPEKRIKYKEVYQFTLNGAFIEKFESSIYASKVTKVNKNNINKVAHDKKGTAGGYIWRYTDDVIESTENVGSFFIKERM